MWALLPQPWTFIRYRRWGFPPDLGLQQNMKASCSFMVKFGLFEFICVCQSWKGYHTEDGGFGMYV